MKDEASIEQAALIRTFNVGTGESMVGESGTQPSIPSEALKVSGLPERQEKGNSATKTIN